MTSRQQNDQPSHPSGPDPGYRPGPLARTGLADGGATLIMTRTFRYPIGSVWSALTDPYQLRQWAPFLADRDLARLGTASLTMNGEDGDKGEHGDSQPARVRVCEPPHVLEFTWGADVLRWELEETASGTSLTLRHTLSDAGMGSAAAAGWHICLDVADGLLAGRPFGPIVGPRAREFGWDDLNDAYARQLDIPAARIW